MASTYTPAEVFSPSDYLRDELTERGLRGTKWTPFCRIARQKGSAMRLGQRRLQRRYVVDDGVPEQVVVDSPVLVYQLVSKCLRVADW